MLKKRLILTVLAALVLVLVFAASASAHEPEAVEYWVVRGARAGTLNPGPDLMGDDQITVRFSPTDELRNSNLLIIFSRCGKDPKTAGKPVMNLEEIIRKPGTSPIYYPEWQDANARWRIYPANPEPALILAGQPSVYKGFVVDFLRSVRAGVTPRIRGLVYEVTEDELQLVGENPGKLALLIKQKGPLAQVTVELFYRLRGTEWTKGSFFDVFGIGKGVRTAFNYEHKTNELPVVVNAYRQSLKLPRRKTHDGGARLNMTLEKILRTGSGLAGDVICFREEYRLYDGEEPQTPQSHMLRGRWSVMWTDHSLHPGFGWRVVAMTNETGSWRTLASDWVQSNGSWTLHIPDSAGYRGEHLRMYYRAYNTYFRPQDRDGNTYSWKGPTRLNISTDHNEGHWYADCDGNAVNGLGELYHAGLCMWSRLYWTGGINPVRENPINVFYPNTWETCSPTRTTPWSCASKNGNLWLIPAHGTRAEVVTHELGHQLNYEYWDNKLPANSGGSHNIWNCYSTRLGMALTEGFANFIPEWVGYPSRHVAEGGFNDPFWDGYAVESRNAPPHCANGWENEIWGARTFWDLHDTRADGDDVLNYIHRGAVIALYLANGPANDGDSLDMRDFEEVYRSNCTSGHEGYISDIFDQNRM